MKHDTTTTMNDTTTMNANANQREDSTMENNNAVETARTLNRAAARRESLCTLRNAVIAAAPAYSAALLCNKPMPAAALDNVRNAAAAYAAALECTKNGEKVTYAAAPAELLIAAAVTLTPRGARENKRMIWDVRGLSFFKNVFVLNRAERADKCKESEFTPAEKDYLKAKTPAEKKDKTAWKVVYEGYTLEKKVAYQQYKAEKEIAKLKHAAAAPLDSKFTFIGFDEWFAAREKDNAAA